MFSASMAAGEEGPAHIGQAPPDIDAQVHPDARQTNRSPDRGLVISCPTRTMVNSSHSLLPGPYNDPHAVQRHALNTPRGNVRDHRRCESYRHKADDRPSSAGQGLRPRWPTRIALA
jgi:hypothetical protein